MAGTDDGAARPTVGENDAVGRAIADEHTILRTEVGSGLHGIAIAGTDDHDELGIAVEPPEHALGTRRWEHFIYRTKPEGVRSQAGDLDLTVFALWKWARLAGGGNPTVLLALFAQGDSVLEISPVGERLRAESERFISRAAGERFRGYLAAQRERLESSRGLRVNRPDLSEAFGYDVKYAAHVLRLGFQGIELMTSGRLTLPMPETERSLIRSVRQGGVPFDDVLRLAGELESQLREAIDSSDLPPRCDIGALDRLVADLYLEHWQRAGLTGTAT